MKLQCSTGLPYFAMKINSSEHAHERKGKSHISRWTTHLGWLGDELEHAVGEEDDVAEEEDSRDERR